MPSWKYRGKGILTLQFDTIFCDDTLINLEKSLDKKMTHQPIRIQTSEGTMLILPHWHTLVLWRDKLFDEMIKSPSFDWWWQDYEVIFVGILRAATRSAHRERNCVWKVDGTFRHPGDQNRRNQTSDTVIYINWHFQGLDGPPWICPTYLCQEIPLVMSIVISIILISCEF